VFDASEASDEGLGTQLSKGLGWTRNGNANNTAPLVALIAMQPAADPSMLQDKKANFTEYSDSS